MGNIITSEELTIKESPKVKNNKEYALDLYSRVIEAVPQELFKTEQGLNRAINDIYLTAMGARPATIPFDGEIEWQGYSSSEMLEIIEENPVILEGFRNIPEVTIRIGPYYDVGESVVVLNTEQYPTTKKILKQLEDLTEKYGNKKPDIPETHIAMGTLLGYVCPIDLNEIWKMKTVYSINYVIDSITHAGVWCPFTPETKKRAKEVLKRFNKVLSLIDKKAYLEIFKMKVQKN